MGKYRIALVGLGVVSEHYTLGLEKSKIFDLIVICDIKGLSALSAKHYPNLPLYTNFCEMSDNERLDYVLIATPVRKHAELAALAVQKNCNVLLEKPMAESMAAVEALLKSGVNSGLFINTIFY